MVSRGEKETKQEIKAEAARDEFEGGVGHLTARGEDGGERGERRFWSFGDMCCRYGHRRRRTGREGRRAASLDIQVAALLVEDGAAFDAAFRHSFPGGGGGGTETESGHSEFLTNTAAATELATLQESGSGGREGERRERRDFSAASLPCHFSHHAKARVLSFPRCGGLSAVMTSQKFFRLGDEKQRRLGKNGRGQKDRLAG